MTRLALNRLLQAAAVIAVVITAVFALLEFAPGDPFAASLDGPDVPASVRVEWRARYGFDLPPAARFGRWVRALAQGDLGYAASHHRPVAAVMRDVLPRTLVLVGIALVLGFALGVLVGLLQVRHHGRRIDRLLDLVTLAGIAVPEFLLALVALIWLAARWRLFPVGGLVSEGDVASWSWWSRLMDQLWHLALPASILAFSVAARVARHQRAALLAVMPEDFIRTARAKGASEWRVLLVHAWPNAVAPVIALLGLAMPSLVGGAVLVERIFGWPGMGDTLFNALLARDYPLVLAEVLLATIVVAITRAATDILAAAFDPRGLRAT